MHEVLADEEPEVPVQRSRQRIARSGRRVCQSVGFAPEARDGLHVLLVLLGDPLRAAGPAGFHGGMHERVLRFDVIRAECKQVMHALDSGCHLIAIVSVQPGDGQQRLGHRGAQRLVDVGINIVPGRGGNGATARRGWDAGCGWCGSGSGKILFHGKAPRKIETGGSRDGSSAWRECRPSGAVAFLNLGSRNPKSSLTGTREAPGPGAIVDRPFDL
ncbi:MAG: hypothetical protein ABI624_19120 [Casimicrobiaceae bacterium]